MKGALNRNKIDYVLFHLNIIFEINKDIKSHIIFSDNPKIIESTSNKIIFLLSSNDMDFLGIRYIDEIPVLFPLSEEETFYSVENNNLIFHHDILKSAFYFLSGYQELSPKYKGKYNRFPYELSIQKKLGITKKPIVNYYFNIVKKGIVEFCQKNSIPFNNTVNNPSFKLFLTHDIDIIDTYNINDLIFYIKVLFGLSKSNLSFKDKIAKVKEYLINYFFTNKNPHWDFKLLRDVEKENNINSAFYFLPKGIKHQDSYYSLDDPRLKKLYQLLIKEGCEIGIHGTVKSALDKKVLKKNIYELEEQAHYKVKGIRQHRLIFDVNITPKIHEDSNLLYDTTLGFAEYEGFRNSFCLPFKLYNFAEDRPYKTWEIPLNVMDATLFKYRRLTPDQAIKSVLEIKNEINKFGGIFTLLWHNGHFDEILYPGITEFYFTLIQKLSMESEAPSFLGKDIEAFLKTKHL